MRKALFFAAIIPPEPIFTELNQEKIFVAENYHSVKALNSPPHITVFPPFHCDASKMEKLVTELHQLASTLNPFYLTLDGFDHFSNKVIYVNVIEKPQLMEMNTSMAHVLNRILEKEDDRKPFNAHITIGFKDLKPENFKKAWEYYEKHEYLRVFEVNDFHLLKHDGKKWQIIHRFGFKK